MKTAVLPSGVRMKFADDTPDSAIRAAVKRRLAADGAPTQAITKVATAAETMARAATQIAEVATRIADLAEAMQGNADTVAEAVDGLSAKVKAGVAQITDVLAAPKVLVRDKDNRPIGLKIEGTDQ